MAEEAHPAVAGVERVVLHVEVPLGEVAAVERQLDALLRLEHRALGAALLGDVAPDAAVAEELAARRDPRPARDDVDQPRAALVGALDLEVEERQLLA